MREGPTSGLLSGLNPHAGGYTVPTLTPADVAAILAPFGRVAPDVMLRYDETSGATELVAGVDNLTDLFGPTKQVASPAFGGALSTQVADASSSRMDAASGSVLEAGTGTITIIHLYELTAAPGGNRQIFGKRGVLGYEVFVNTSGHVRAVYDSSLAAPVPTVAADHGFGNAEVILAKRSETDNESGLWTRLGNSVLAAPGGTMADSEEFSVGKDSRSAAPARHVMTLAWLGANGDGFGEAERYAIAVAIGTET